MITYVSQVMHSIVKSAVHCWLGGQVVEEAKDWSQSATFWVHEKDLTWWPIALEGKRVKVTFEIMDAEKRKRVER